MALERPPRWGLIAIVVLLLANVGLVLLLVQRQNAAPDPTTPVAAATATPTTSARTTTSAPTTTSGPATTSSAAPTSTDAGGLAVYGDGYSSGNSEGGIGAAGWPAQVAQQLGMQLQLTAATLAGYVRPGSTGQTYPQLVQAQPPADAAVTVVFGSRNDEAATPAEVQAAAAQTFQEILAADPTTKLVVIGPCWSSSAAPAELTAVSAAVQAAAEAAGATYVDPLTQGWFADPTGLVSTADGISLLDAGHTYLTGLIAPLVDTARSR
ncbi:GDSL-like Lipase/Acylhydrolase family protein [Klenkia soli]|uniref:GDSL-like Lipase/Acylhydrolase family protein n=1 Tax=Klenkia soli TaxID=1052260 RepID=A0A1H0NXB4_9ACTN|nr:GDSL-type esterase/lipase family protein [Klenkia soli]SDO97324.1 GDSL-like Lipase/Acylhydrolase family protein [Klenkia soli]